MRPGSALFRAFIRDKEQQANDEQLSSILCVIKFLFFYVRVMRLEAALQLSVSANSI